MTWAELQRFPKQDSNKTSDLLDWVERAIEQLDRDFYIRPKQRTTGTVNRKWLTDKIGGQFTFATCKSTDESVFIHQNSFVHELSYADFTEGQKFHSSYRSAMGNSLAGKWQGRDTKMKCV